MGIVLKNLNAISLFVISLNITDPDVISLSLRPELPLSLRWGGWRFSHTVYAVGLLKYLARAFGPAMHGAWLHLHVSESPWPEYSSGGGPLSWCVSYCILFVSFKYKSIRYSIIVIYLSNFFFNLTKRWMNKLWKE